MPTVALHAGGLCFSNGRHRFAWLRDHGVEALPLATIHGKRLEAEVGTELRESRLVVVRE
jgi:hypothetical protein